MWFDTHCHLHLCDGDRSPEDVVDAARVAGVVGMVTLATDVDSSRRSAELTTLDGVWAAAGVHPNSSEQWDDDAAEAIDRLLQDDDVVAVGESGLDFYRDAATPQAQHRAFADHIALAKKHDKPLVIHTRESVAVALDVLETNGPPSRLVFHCWSGEHGDLERALELGAHVSFAGNVSFPSAEALRRVASAVPDDRLLVETDSPFLTPVPHRGRPNEPRNVAFVGVAVAEARGVSVEMLADVTTRNARSFFGLG